MPKKLSDETTPNPGTEEAMYMGCTCPILDNNFGGGAFIAKNGKPAFWYSAGCPVHRWDGENGNDQA